MRSDLLALFQKQHGLVARWQLRDLEPIRSRRRPIYTDTSTQWATPRVLRHMAAPTTVDQNLMLAVLDAGRSAVLWGKSAAALWGFGRFRSTPAHVAVGRDEHRPDSFVGQLHQIRSLERQSPTLFRDVPTARPESVVLWLAGMWTHRLGHEAAVQRTGAALDQAWRQRLIDGRYLHELIDRSGGRGRSGIVVMRELLADRPPGYTPAGSRLEKRFEEIIPRRIMDDLERQVTVDVDPVVRTVDYRMHNWPLVVEINGEVWHSSATDRAADEERYRRFNELGWSVAVFWEHDIWHDPGVVAAAMRNLHDNPDPWPVLHRPTPAPWAV